MTHIAHFVFTFLILCSYTEVQSQSDWKLEKSSKGIEVFTRRVEETTIKEFRARVIIKSEMEKITEVVEHVKYHPDWMYGLKSADVLNEEPKILQYVRSAPFPFTDRYVIMHSITEASGDSCRITLEHSDYPASPDVDGLVEIVYIKGYWLLTKIDDHTTSVTYQFVTDPGGNLPDWLVNSFIVKTPFLTLKNLRGLLE